MSAAVSIAHEHWRPMRGQVVLRELDSVISELWTPSDDPKSRYVKTHRGRVIALGPPALIHDKYEVPYHFKIGDIVQYHYRANLEATTRPWPPDGELATWVPQFDIDGVWQ